MLRKVQIHEENFEFHTPFRISRGVKDTAKTIRITIEQDGKVGHGECIPYPRYDESQESVRAQVESVKQEIEQGASCDDLLDLLPAGAARNAVDCALWDLKCQIKNQSIFELLNISKVHHINTSQTISIDTPEAMAEAASRLSGMNTIKVKLGNNDDDLDRMAAIHDARPDAKLVVDANEGWSFNKLREIEPQLQRLGVTMIEQPLHSNEDHKLEQYQSSITLCADESLHTIDDLEAIARRYQMINIKLDKTGGLTHALELKSKAQDMGLQIMIGCMTATSLSIMPAYILAIDSDFNDLDGPTWLKQDRDNGVTFKAGKIGSGTLWGNIVT